MLLVGVIEIIAGIMVALKSRVGITLYLRFDFPIGGVWRSRQDVWNLQ